MQLPVIITVTDIKLIIPGHAAGLRAANQLGMSSRKDLLPTIIDALQ